ncbi:MAG: WGR domain-containing protein [Thermaceae bacterium]|nr:WGR domain-containing protein [Thermaceae bacterium]
MKKYLELVDGNSSKFWEIEQQDNQLIIRYGKIGSSGQTIEKAFSDAEAAQKEFDKLLREKTNKGYAEVTQSGEILSAQDFQPITVSQAAPPTWEMLAERFNPVFEMPFGDFADELSEIRLYEADTGGNVHFPGDFVLEGWESSDKDFNAVIAGNLVVDGNLRLGSESIGNFVLVMGNVKAKAITLSGTVSLDVRGSAKVQHGIWGMYGDDGYLSISGDVTTPVVLNTLYFNMALSGKVKAVTIDTSYGDLDADFDDDDVENALVNAGLEPEGGMDARKVAKYLREGKPVLKKGAKSARVLVQEELERLSKSGQPTEELDLSNKKLGAFPKLLTTLSTLKKLNLSHNAIKVLPEEIGKLEALRVLDASNNDGLVLPESIGNLKSLKVLKHDYNQGFKLPESFGELKGLEELSLYQNSGGKPLEFPQVLTELSGLRKLDIGSNSFKSLPESFLKLKNLKELRLDASLCYLDSLPDLSQLKKLRVLHADGLTSYTTRPKPKQSLLRSFFEIASLEELYIDHHNQEEDRFDDEGFQELLQNLSHDPERQAEIRAIFKKDPSTLRWTGISRPDLIPEHLAGISKLKKLKKLDLSFSRLEHLPEEIYGMGTLQEINLQYNHLSKAERERVAQAFPNTKIDFRNNSSKDKADEPTETGVKRKMVELVRKANEKRHSPPYLEALKLYDQALKMFDSGEVADDYNFIYIHYCKTWIYGHLAYRPNNLSEADIQRYKDLGLAEAKLCLELVPANALVWHYTDEGQFHQEVIRYTSNTVAWHLYEHAQPSDTQSLEAIERGVAFAHEPRYYYLHDTKVRILSKMGCTDQAYRIVQRILQAGPDFGDFQDLKKDKGYKKWLSQRG